MWLVISAAADVSGSDSSQPIIVALISALGGVLVAAVGALVSLARREARDEAPQSAPSLGERTAVLERRANDNDERDDVQDHRLESVERYLDRRDPRWRP